MCKESTFKDQTARSKVGYTILFYLPCLFVFSIFLMLLPSITSSSSLWALVGIKMFSLCLYIYGAAEMYCYRTVMLCSTARILTPFLLLFWSVQPLTWVAFTYSLLEISFGTSTLIAYLSENLSNKMLKQLTERTLLGGLDESVIMPMYTRVAVCLMSVLEWLVGFRCIIRPEFIEWFSTSPPIDDADEILSFHDASLCFGTTSVIASSVLLMVVVVFKVAAIKWWIAAYHISIAVSLIPLRIIFTFIPFANFTVFTIFFLNIFH